MAARHASDGAWYERRMRTRIAVLVVLVAVLAACSSGASERSTTTERASEQTTTTAAKDASAIGRPSDGCGRDADVATMDPDERPGDVEQTIESGGVERTYRLGVPAGYDPDEPAPLLLNLHGSGSNALQASVYGDVPRKAGEHGFVTVTPDAIDAKWELARTGRDDDFLVALVDDIEQRYCIDLDRVHVIGMSLGAWKAGLTACQHPDRFASAALVTVEVHPDGCDPMSVVAFHGTADGTVPYGEGGDVDPANTPWKALPGARENIANWAAGAGCNAQPTISEIGDDVELRTFDGCDEGYDVELYTIDGGGHTWPGADIDIAPKPMTTQTIDATDLALDWFEAHPLSR
jgi:polyhydroxybutyrate depolymerase